MTLDNLIKKYKREQGILQKQRCNKEKQLDIAKASLILTMSDICRVSEFLEDLKKLREE